MALAGASAFFSASAGLVAGCSGLASGLSSGLAAGSFSSVPFAAFSFSSTGLAFSSVSSAAFFAGYFFFLSSFTDLSEFIFPIVYLTSWMTRSAFIILVFVF